MDEIYYSAEQPGLHLINDGKFARIGRADSDKKVNRKRRKSALNDRAFRSLRKGLRAREHLSAGCETIVSSIPSHTPSSSSPSPSTPHTPSTPDDDTPRLLTPRPWRDVGDETRAEFYHHGLTSLGPVYTLNLNLAEDVIREARLNAKGFLDYVRRRIARHVNKALGRPVEWWACLEEENGRPHLHGEIGASADEIKAVRKALRLAGGEWAVGRRQFQAVTKPIRMQIGRPTRLRTPTKPIPACARC